MDAKFLPTEKSTWCRTHTWQILTLTTSMWPIVSRDSVQCKTVTVQLCLTTHGRPGSSILKVGKCYLCWRQVTSHTHWWRCHLYVSTAPIISCCLNLSFMLNGAFWVAMTRLVPGVQNHTYKIEDISAFNIWCKNRFYTFWWSVILNM